MLNFVKALQTELPVINAAKWSFAAAVLVVTMPLVGGAWFLSGAIAGGTVSTLEERIKFKDDQLAARAGERRELESRVAEIRATMEAMAERLKALEEKILTGVLSDAPSSLQLLVKPNGNGALEKLADTFERSGWTVTPGVETPATTRAFQNNTEAIIKASSPGGFETMKEALDAALIPYEVRDQDGDEVIWLKSLYGASVPNLVPATP
ncbi:hypothetical protein [Devosia sp.]|uniref:hypothetical protein n=1 Tax=Devosia sp. TaxID=1871048 RepID=UPI002F183DAA